MERSVTDEHFQLALFQDINAKLSNLTKKQTDSSDQVVDL